MVTSVIISSLEEKQPALNHSYHQWVFCKLSTQSFTLQIMMLVNFSVNMQIKYALSSPLYLSVEKYIWNWNLSQTNQTLFAMINKSISSSWHYFPEISLLPLLGKSVVHNAPTAGSWASVLLRRSQERVLGTMAPEGVGLSAGNGNTWAIRSAISMTSLFNSTSQCYFTKCILFHSRNKHTTTLFKLDKFCANQPQMCTATSCCPTL